MPRITVPDSLGGVVPISKGGTSATTSSTGLANLGGIPLSQKSALNGVPSLDGSGLIADPINADKVEFADPLYEVAYRDGNGTIPAAHLPVATSTEIGAVKAGTNITIGPDGTISSIGGGGGGGDVTIVNDETTNSSNYYPAFMGASSGVAANVYTSASKLKFNPSLGRLSAVEFNSLSDMRFKDSLRKIEMPLEKIECLTGYHFRYTETKALSAGLMAQDVMEVLPELVIADAENGDRLTLNYNGLSGLLVEAIKTLSQQVRELQAEVSALKGG